MMPQPQPPFIPSVQPQQLPEQWLYQLEVDEGKTMMRITIFSLNGTHVSIMEPNTAVTVLTDALKVARQGASAIWTPG